MRAALRLAAKDLRAELRSKESATAMLVLALLVAGVGLVAFGREAARAPVAAAVLWTGLTFAASLGFGRAFLAERDRGTWDALLALPVERGTLYLGKVLANVAVVLAVALVALPVYLAFAGARPSAAPLALLALVVLLGAVGLAASGTLLAAVAAETRAREALVPVLLVPVVFPVLIAAVGATRDALAGEGFEALRGELALLVGYDMAFLAASWLLFESVVE